MLGWPSAVYLSVVFRLWGGQWAANPRLASIQSPLLTPRAEIHSSSHQSGIMCSDIFLKET